MMYPEAANYLPPPQLWCALFFFMSIFLGIDSQVIGMKIYTVYSYNNFSDYEVSYTLIHRTIEHICGVRVLLNLNFSLSSAASRN